MYQAVLFDMDGVIADTERSVTEFWQRLAADLGYLLRAEDLERHVYGHRADHTLRVLFPEVPPARTARSTSGSGRTRRAWSTPRSPARPRCSARSAGPACRSRW
ncbi:HAD family hydrolase [Nonomuraea thailandensis]